METRQWRNQQTATKAIDERLTSIEKSLAHLNYLIDSYQGTPINRLIWKLSGFPSVEELITERTRLNIKPREELLKNGYSLDAD